MILSGKTFSQEVQLRKEKNKQKNKQTKNKKQTKKTKLKTKSPDVLKSLSFHKYVPLLFVNYS